MRFKNTFFLCLVVNLCFLTNKVNAQSNPNYFIPPIFPNSPNTTAFAKFGNYPVSYFTGLPDISITIDTIEAGDLKLPITLAYHASGIKVSDVASWAGLGWSINTGGSITRSIMGMPDETGYLQGEMPTHTLNPAVGSDLNELYAIVNQQTDTRPDIFSYNIPGHHGNFFFNALNGYQVQKIPFSPIQILKHADITHGDALSFTINDEHGVTYLLGQNYTEHTALLSASGNFGAPTSAWLLEKMISANRRDTINLSYKQDSISHPDALFEICSITDQSNIKVTACGTDDDSGPTYLSYNKTPNVTEQQLQSITFRNGRVDFDLSTAPRQDVGGGSTYGGADCYGLKDIRISIYNYSTKSYEVQRTIQFFQTYFGTSAAKNMRLRLDSIEVLDKAGSVIEHYRFKYNTAQVLPNYGSLSRDYWGYYNKKQDGVVPNGTRSGTLIPAVTIDQEAHLGDPTTYTTIGSSVPNSRACDSNYMQACMLDTIYYPTGGYTTFTYQTNRYVDTAGHTQLAGGLRVTSINSYDGINSTPTTKTIQYGAGQPIFLISGINPVNYGFFSSGGTNRDWGQPGPGLGIVECSESRARTYYSQTTASLDPIDGTPVGYTFVTEFNGTPSNNVGQTVYHYNFQTDQPSTASSTGIFIYQSNFFLRGQLLKKTQYIHNANGSYQTIRVDSNTYYAFPEKTYTGVGLAVGQMVYNNGRTQVPSGGGPPDDTDGAFVSSPYDISSQDELLTASTVKMYDSTDSTKFTTSTTVYAYDDTTHLQIAQTTHVDSKGNIHITSLKYPYSYLSGGTTHNAVLDTMINHNIDEPIEKSDSLRNVTTLLNAVVGAQFNQYQPGEIAGSVVPYKISVLNIVSPITNFVHSSIVSGNLTGDSRYVQMISFDLYDFSNNIIHYTPRNATPTFVIWDYQRNLPIAQVKNAPTQASTGNQAYTSFEADGKGGWTYTGTPITDLTAPTGKLVYPLSSGNITNTFYYNTKANILSYWSNGSVATVVCGSTGVTGTALTTVNGWTYYEHTIPASGATITISGTMSIDELRLYPIDAEMTTYTYAPEGLTSIADTKGAINYFEYDYFQRLKNIKDFYSNIVNNYGYHTYDQTIGNDAMSNTYTRNNCPAGYSPGSLSYAVPANKYYSSTKTSANAEATYDMNTNGQAKANQNCHCTVITTPFNLSNTTGISGFQATFSGIGTPYNFPTTSPPATIINVPVGTYTTISVGAVGSMTHTFTLTGYTPVVGHNASFSNVHVTSGSNLTLSIN